MDYCVVLSMVGYSNLELADAFRRLDEQVKLQFIGIRHEGAASFSASAYGKLKGKSAACFVIADRGSTNLFTGLGDAKVDRAPILALTGQDATQVIGTGNFQELHLVGAFQAVAEFNHKIEHSSKHTELLMHAIKLAILKRDASHLTFPDEVQNIPAESIQAPATTTFKGKGQISDSHPLGCGLLGRSITPIATYFMNEADLLISIGSSFSNHTGITPKKPTIQIDFDPLAHAKFHKISLLVLGEISETLKFLIKNKDQFNTDKINSRPEIKNNWLMWKEPF